jgi:hypothetical protein
MSEKNIFIVGSTVFYLIATILMFVFLTITYVNVSNSEYAYMYKIGENWQRGPIMNVNSDAVFCTGDSTPLITDMWQGTEGGCYCTFSFSLYGPLRRDYCRRSRDNYSFCSSVAPIAPIDYKVWRGVPLCANRAPVSYLDLNIAKFPSYCGVTSKSCGVIDSLNNVLCVPHGTECPYNYVNILPVDQTPLINFNFTAFNLTGGDQIIFSNNAPEGTIYSEFIISQGKPCADPSRKNFQEMPYLLDPYYANSDCSVRVGNYTYDDRFKLIDSYSNNNLLAENNIMPLVQRLPMYPYQSEIEVNLFARNYIGLNPTCLQELRDTGITDNIIYDLLDTKDYMIRVENLSLAAMLTGIFLLLFVIFTTIIILCCKFEDSELKTALLFYIAPFILSLAIFVISIIVALNLKGYTSQTDVLTRKECVDDITFQAANNFEDNIKTAYSLSITSSSISGILFLIPVIFFIMMCWWH